MQPTGSWGLLTSYDGVGDDVRQSLRLFQTVVNWLTGTVTYVTYPYISKAATVE